MERQKDLNEKLNKLFNDLDLIFKKEIDAVKNLKYPSSGLKMVSEAVCILFGQKPSFPNFQKLLDDNFLIRLKSADYSNLSDFDFKKLDEYINNKDFTNEKINETSKLGGFLCEWVKITTKLSEILSKVNS